MGIVRGIFSRKKKQKQKNEKNALENAIREYYKVKNNDATVYGVYSALAEETIFLPVNNAGELLSLTFEDQEIIPIFSSRNQISDNEPIQISPTKIVNCLDFLVKAHRHMIINPFDEEGMTFLLPYESIEKLLIPIIKPR